MQNDYEDDANLKKHMNSDSYFNSLNFITQGKLIKNGPKTYFLFAIQMLEFISQRM